MEQFEPRAPSTRNPFVQHKKKVAAETTVPFTENQVREIKRHAEGLPEKKQPYSLEGSLHVAALKYRPEFLAKGGEHLVYDIPGNPDVVVKANALSIGEGLAYAEALGVDADSDNPRYVRFLNERVAYKRKMQTALRTHFGREHVVPQKYFVANIPLPQDFDTVLEPFVGFQFNDIPQHTDNAKGIVAVQERVPELKRSDRLTPVGINVERKQLSKMRNDGHLLHLYDTVTTGLMSAESTQTSELKPEDFRRLLSSPSLDTILESAEQDAELREMLRDFVERAASFAEETGETIDLAIDNTIFYKQEDGTWTYRIVDGLFGLATNVIDNGKEAMLKARLGQPITEIERNALIQSVNFTRAINGIGKLVGAKKFFTFIEPDEETDVLGTIAPMTKRWTRDAA